MLDLRLWEWSLELGFWKVDLKVWRGFVGACDARLGEMRQAWEWGVRPKDLWPGVWCTRVEKI